MAFDYKKEYKELYIPKNVPSVIELPSMNYISVKGKGDPNEEGGEFKKAIEMLYCVGFTIKMSRKTSYNIEGYFEYVMPPLEGLWKQEGEQPDIDYNRKDELDFIAMIRLPDFVTEKDVQWAIAEASEKKKRDLSKVEFMRYCDGICVQCMHIGSYDSEPQTIALMHEHAAANGFITDNGGLRLHHEIYLSDPRRCAENKLKTVIRQPVIKVT